MYEAKLDPVRDAGKFVYHLKTLRKAGLVAIETRTKKKPKKTPPQTTPPWTPRQRRDSPPTRGRTETPRLGLGSILRRRSRNRRIRPAQQPSKTPSRCTFLGTNTPRGCRVLDPQT